MSGDTFTANKFEWLEAIAKDSRLHSTAVRVAIVIASHINRQSGEAFPSIKTISTKSATPERTVKHAVAKLCEEGFLKKRRGGFSKSNVYEMAGVATKGDELSPVLSEAMGCPSDGVSEAMDCPNVASSEAMGCPSLGQWVAPRSGNGLPPNPLMEPIEDNPKEETYSPASEPEAAAPSRESVKQSDDWEPEFAKFWKQYPRRKGRGAAEKAYRAALKIVSAETLMAACLRFSAAEDAAYRKGKEAQYTPHASTWLNRRSWEDEPDPVVTEVKRPAATNSDRKARQADVALMLKGHARSIRTEDSSAFDPEATRMRIAR